ncbi:MAG: hypothetical protein IPP40_18110 [bacterium]|nr:hypothetical protein [bacterium]
MHIFLEFNPDGPGALNTRFHGYAEIQACSFQETPRHRRALCHLTERARITRLRFENNVASPEWSWDWVAQFRELPRLSNGADSSGIQHTQVALFSVGNMEITGLRD